MFGCIDDRTSLFSLCTGPNNVNFILIDLFRFGALRIIPVNQSVVPVQLSNLMCEGTEQNLLDCNTTEVRIIAERQINQQMCRTDAAVTCIGRLIY